MNEVSDTVKVLLARIASWKKILSPHMSKVDNFQFIEILDKP